jgi:hypothetical protein
MARVDELDKSSVMDIQNSALLDIFLLGDGPVMVLLLERRNRSLPPTPPDDKTKNNKNKMKI